jgi:hypothetical protein
MGVKLSRPRMRGIRQALQLAFLNPAVSLMGGDSLRAVRHARYMGFGLLFCSNWLEQSSSTKLRASLPAVAVDLSPSYASEFILAKLVLKPEEPSP